MSNSARKSHWNVASTLTPPFGIVTVQLFPELQHFYKRVPDGLSPDVSFAQDSESEPSVAGTIDSWITALLDGKK